MKTKWITVTLCDGLEMFHDLIVTPHNKVLLLAAVTNQFYCISNTVLQLKIKSNKEFTMSQEFAELYTTTLFFNNQKSHSNSNQVMLLSK